MTVLLCLLQIAANQPSLLGDDSVAGLLHREDVQVEIKMTPAQKKRWGEVDRLPKVKNASAFASDPIVLADPEEVERKNAEREKKAWELLGPDQTVRLHQLYVQRAGPRVLLRPEVQAQLELSTAQNDQVRQAKAKHVFAVRELMREVARRNTDLSRADPKKVNELREKIERQLVEELDQVPNQEQRNRLVEMGGKKFVFFERVFK